MMLNDLANAIFGPSISRDEAEAQAYWEHQRDHANMTSTLQRQIDELKKRIEALENA